jgi:hypothetical protein
MRRPLDARLDQVAGRRTAGASEHAAAAIRNRHLWRAQAAMGEVIRNALARAGIDAAQATSLGLADDAEAALLALPDTPELQRSDHDNPAATMGQERTLGDVFECKITALAQGFVGVPPPDFANASFAELFAWALAQPAADYNAADYNTDSTHS